MNIKSILGALVLAAILAMTPETSEAGGWRLIGKKSVTDRLDHDILHAPGPRRYSKIRICVHRNPVRFYDLDVRFAYGGKQDVRIARRINAGRCSRAIKLKGGKRNIRYVKFLYEETSLRYRRATVSLYGR